MDNIFGSVFMAGKCQAVHSTHMAIKALGLGIVDVTATVEFTDSLLHGISVKDPEGSAA